MNVRIGDIVRFISEKLEGKVTGIIDQNTVNVYCNEYGFEIPAAVNDLVVIHTDFNTAQAETAQTHEQKNIVIKSADTVYLAIVPENFNNLTDTHYELHLVNDTDQMCLFSVLFYNGTTYSGVSAGNCSPDSACSLSIYSIKEIDNSIKAVKIQVIFYQKGTHTPKSIVDTQIKINSVSLCKTGTYKHARWFKQVCILRPLDKETIIDEEEIDTRQLLNAKKEKDDNNFPEKRPHKQIINNILEVDLHINQLVETTSGMDSKDMLDYQLDVFHKTLEEFKLRKGQKIVFIHGKGDGILRQRILWELQTRYKRYHHQDASFKQYGYGATMVTIK